MGGVATEGWPRRPYRAAQSTTVTTAAFLGPGRRSLGTAFLPLVEFARRTRIKMRALMHSCDYVSSWRRWRA